MLMHLVLLVVLEEVQVITMLLIGKDHLGHHYKVEKVAIYTTIPFLHLGKVVEEEEEQMGQVMTALLMEQPMVGLVVMEEMGLLLAIQYLIIPQVELVFFLLILLLPQLQHLIAVVVEVQEI